MNNFRSVALHNISVWFANSNPADVVVCARDVGDTTHLPFISVSSLVGDDDDVADGEVSHGLLPFGAIVKHC